MELLEGMPLIARKGNEKLNICNNETFTIKTIQEDFIIVTDGSRDVEVEIDQIATMFYVAFCLTVHKCQGQTYHQSYMIHEWDIYDDTMKYVALSRATDVNFINIKI